MNARFAAAGVVAVLSNVSTVMTPAPFIVVVAVPVVAPVSVAAATQFVVTGVPVSVTV